MSATLRRPAAARVITTVLLAATAVMFPGAAAPAVAATDQLPAQSPAAGAVLHPQRPTLVLPATGYRLTGRFGDRSGLWSSVHTGLDFAAASGTPIRSITAGRVTATGYDGAYGNKTVVRLSDGTDLWYCHQSSVRVTTGERVHVGEVIGTIGSTGNVTGPHLHLEVRPRPSVPVDPYRWLRTRGLRP